MNIFTLVNHHPLHLPAITHCLKSFGSKMLLQPTRSINVFNKVTTTNLITNPPPVTEPPIIMDLLVACLRHKRKRARATIECLKRNKEWFDRNGLVLCSEAHGGGSGAPSEVGRAPVCVNIVASASWPVKGCTSSCS